jgi:hypothetical protein
LYPAGPGTRTMMQPCASAAKANVSAYKAAQGQGKPASSPFAKKT